MRKLALLAVLLTFAAEVPLTSGAGEKALAHVQNLVDLGPRLAGSPAELQAVDYIEREFRSYGLETWVENFTFNRSYLFTRSELRVLTPLEIELPCVPVVYSPPCLVRGGLVRLGENLGGKILLLEARRLSRELWLTKPSPLAVLFYTENFPARSEIWAKPPEVPLASIGWRDARRLLELLEQGEVVVELEIEAEVAPRPLFNVIAKLQGEEDEMVVVSAHHDSMLTPGAVDDASGVAAVLEIARALAGTELERTVVFVTFSGEEFDLLGSSDFVRRRMDAPIVAVLHFDVLGAGPENGLRVGLRAPPEYSTTPWLDEFLVQIAENLGMRAVPEPFERIRGYTDHVSFTRVGIPATWIYWVNPQRDLLSYIHTLEDNLDMISEEVLKRVVEFGIEAVRRLAEEEIPYRTPTFQFRLAIFTLLTVAAAVLAVGGGCYFHYERGRGWEQVLKFLLPTLALSILLAYHFLLQ